MASCAVVLTVFAPVAVMPVPVTSASVKALAVPGSLAVMLRVLLPLEFSTVACGPTWLTVMSLAPEFRLAFVAWIRGSGRPASAPLKPTRYVPLDVAATLTLAAPTPLSAPSAVWIFDATVLGLPDAEMLPVVWPLKVSVKLPLLAPFSVIAWRSLLLVIELMAFAIVVRTVWLVFAALVML